MSAPTGTSITTGIDLAAEPKGTALALIEWSRDAARLVDLRLGVNDGHIVEAAARADAIGIDCAFGWPVEFVDFVSRHAELRSALPGDDGGMEWRRRLAYRETDRAVRALTGRWPLSVSTDRLGLTAMRCAGLLARLEAGGIPVDRAGSGRVFEVYPGASLRAWGVETRGYRAEQDVRATLLTALARRAPWLDVGGFAPLMIASGDAFDAVIAALSSRSAAMGRSTRPTAEQQDRARVEGWICLPSGRLEDLVGPST